MNIGRNVFAIISWPVSSLPLSAVVVESMHYMCSGWVNLAIWMDICNTWVNSWNAKLVKSLTRSYPCDVKSHEALFTAKRVNRLYHQTTLRFWIKQRAWQCNEVWHCAKREQNREGMLLLITTNWVSAREMIWTPPQPTEADDDSIDEEGYSLSRHQSAQYGSI